MPFMIVNTKQINIDQPMFNQLTKLIRKCRPQIDNMSILEAYQIKEDGDYAILNNKVYVILRISGHRLPKYLCLGRNSELQPELDALNPTFITDRRMRIDNHLSFPDQPEIVYHTC